MSYLAAGQSDSYCNRSLTETANGPTPPVGDTVIPQSACGLMYRTSPLLSVSFHYIKTETSD